MTRPQKTQRERLLELLKEFGIDNLENSRQPYDIVLTPGQHTNVSGDSGGVIEFEFNPLTGAFESLGVWRQ